MTIEKITVVCGYANNNVKGKITLKPKKKRVVMLFLGLLFEGTVLSMFGNYSTAFLNSSTPMRSIKRAVLSLFLALAV